MSEQGHRRSRSYFSEFAVADNHSPQLDEEQQRELHKREIEEELEHKAKTLLRGHRRSSSVTLPTSVRFSVNRPPANREPFANMSRPRSPPKKHTSDNYSQMEMLLDQALLGIRQKVHDLSTQRLKMETQMDALASGIKEAHIQCKQRLPAHPVLSRVRNVAVMKRHPYKHSNGSHNDVDSPTPNQSSVHLSLRESLRLSSILKRNPSLSDSIDSAPSLSPLSNAFSPSLNRMYADLSSKSSLSTDNSSSDWQLDSQIPELPESPRSLVSPSSPPQTSTPSTSSPLVRPFARRQHSVPNFNRQSSVPSFHRRDTPTKFPSQHRSSIHENSLAMIRDNQLLDCSTLSQTSLSQASLSQASLSQASSCSGSEGSPHAGNTPVMRRSSLTGQLEHIDRKPRVKRINSCSITQNDPEKLRLSLVTGQGLSNSLSDLIDGKRDRSASVAYKQAPSKFNSLRRLSHHRSIIIPSIETTV